MKVGVIGGGQLGRMLALAGIPLGLEFIFLDPNDEPSSRGLGEHIKAKFDDDEALATLEKQCDVITFDIETLDPQSLKPLEKKLFPSVRALRTAQDRLSEKQLFESLDIPVAEYAAVDDLQSLRHATSKLGKQSILKTRRFGYDGRGQENIADAGSITEVWEPFSDQGCIVEMRVPFDCEVSQISVRGKDKKILHYPLSLNTHREGMLRHTCAPFVDSDLENKARVYTEAILEELDYVGTFVVEFFALSGALIANEMAPRVHNSGHWTIEGAHTSQFENHLRAILGWPLGDCSVLGHSVMINIVGEHADHTELLKNPFLHFHDYGKEARAERKLGHFTLVSSDASERDLWLREFY